MDLRQKKIIHIDMDCFFAAVELRDRPELRSKPVAIGGMSGGRGVLCTANYEARKYGVGSAMATAIACKKCPSLILIKPNFRKYKEVSDQVFEIFGEYTDIIQGLSLDEAYLDVTECERNHNLAVKMAKEIREKITKVTRVTASAGVSYNKLLAKIASELNKPNGQFTITPWDAHKIIPQFPVGYINGVGKVTKAKMQRLGFNTFEDLEKCSKLDLVGHFGRFGPTLYNYCRGIDSREVITERERKSLSTERTFEADIKDVSVIKQNIAVIYQELLTRLKKCSDRKIKTLFVKIKYDDFEQTTIEKSNLIISEKIFIDLLLERYEMNRPVRLIGVGVKFFGEDSTAQLQLPFAV